MTRCHICGDTGYWTGLTRPHGDPDPPAEYTGPRCTDREATAILSSHQDHPEHRPSLATMADGTCGCTLCRALRDLLDARTRVKELEKWYDTVLSIVDSLDDPYRGVNWYGVTQELCARELEHLRSVLVPLVRGEQGGGDG